MLGAPGGADTLDQLHYWLAALHTVPLGPVAHLMPAVFRWEGDGAAHQQCRALDRWYTAAVGVAMPLALLRRWDAEARRSRAAARRRRPGATEGAAAAQDGGAPQRVQQEQRQEQQQEQRQRNDSAAEGDLARWTEGPGNKGSEADVSLLQAVFLSSSTLWVFMTALHAW